MKSLLFALAMITFLSCQENEKPEQEPALNAETQKEDSLPDEIADPEDCDDKAKKAQEKPEDVMVDLSGGGDAGCTIE